MSTTSRFLKKAKEIESESHHRRSDRSRPGHGGGHDESNWLVSYADMMTLLCGFFIMMFSLSTLEPKKAKIVKEALAKEFHGPYEKPTDQLAKQITEILHEAGISREAVVKSDALGVSVVFESAIFFDTLSSDVRPQGREVLSRLIEALYGRQADERKAYKVVVEGHTDSRPILNGVYPSNWELSGARAARVVRMFLDRGFDPGRLAAIGYADTRPEVPSRTPAGTYDEAALAKNRRVVIRILQPKVDAIPLPEVPAAAEAEVRQAAATPATPAD